VERINAKHQFWKKRTRKKKGSHLGDELEANFVQSLDEGANISEATDHLCDLQAAAGLEDTMRLAHKVEKVGAHQGEAKDGNVNGLIA